MDETTDFVAIGAAQGWKNGTRYVDVEVDDNAGGIEKAREIIKSVKHAQDEQKDTRRCKFTIGLYCSLHGL